MARPTFNDNQARAEELLKASLGNKIDQTTVDEILAMLSDENRRAVVTGNPKKDTETLLKLKMRDEPNPLKKAAISAMIISNKLDD